MSFRRSSALVADIWGFRNLPHPRRIRRGIEITEPTPPISREAAVSAAFCNINRHFRSREFGAMAAFTSQKAIYNAVTPLAQMAFRRRFRKIPPFSDPMIFPAGGICGGRSDFYP